MKSIHAMKIAYFINEYPKASHSFIRREILALERRKIDILRIALRVDETNLRDTDDFQELKKTKYVLQQPIIRIIGSSLRCFWLNRKGVARALILACKIGWNSERGLLRHFAYFLEACVVADWTKGNEIHHIHCHFGTNSAAIVMIAKEIGRIPFSITIHGSEEFDKPEFISLSEKIKRSEFVAGVSSFGRSQILRWTDHKTWEKVIIVRCGIDQMFKHGDLPPVPDVPRLVCVGRLCKEKGQLLLIDVMNDLVNEGTNMELVLAGDGPIRNEVQILIEKYNLQSRVRITGWISNEQVRNEIVNSRAMILPSFIENLPVVIMEAMALKRPIISTYVAGIPELVSPGETGWLAPASDKEQLKKIIRVVLETPVSDLQEMGEKARKKVLMKHDIDIEVAKLLPLFEASYSQHEVVG